MRIYLVFVIEFVKKYWIFLIFLLFLSGILAFLLQKTWKPRALASVQILLPPSYLNPTCICLLENQKQMLKSAVFWQKILEKSSKQYQFFIRKNQLWQEIEPEKFPFQVHVSTHSEQKNEKFAFFKIDVKESEFLWYFSSKDKENIAKIPFRSANFKTQNIHTKNHYLIIQPKTNIQLESGIFKMVWSPFETIFPDILDQFSLEQIPNTSVLSLRYIDETPQKARQILRFILEEFNLFLQNSIEDKLVEPKEKITSSAFLRPYFSFIEPIQLKETSILGKAWLSFFLVFLIFLVFFTRKKIYFTQFWLFRWLNFKSLVVHLYFAEPKNSEDLLLFSQKKGIFSDQNNEILEDFSDFSSLIYADKTLIFQSFSESTKDFFLFLHFAHQRAKKAKKILLIDLHWKNPQFIKYFPFSFQNSLRDYCVVENLPLFYLPVSYSPHVDLIFCEQWEPEICNFEPLLTWAKLHYDQIIFYTPFFSYFPELSTTKIQLFAKNQLAISNYLNHMKKQKNIIKSTTFLVFYQAKKMS